MYAYSQGGHETLGSHCHHHVHQLLRVFPEQGNNCLLCAVGEGAAAITPAMALHQLLHQWSTAETELPKEGAWLAEMVCLHTVTHMPLPCH